MLSRIAWLLFMVCCLTAGAAQSPVAETGSKPKEGSAEVPKAELASTQHRIAIGAATISYKATAGTLIVRDSNDVPYASVGYVAYTQNDVADPSRRPITFSYNGGPGLSARDESSRPTRPRRRRHRTPRSITVAASSTGRIWS
jgi:carboxypeptidase C (cathepsin A)